MAQSRHLSQIVARPAAEVYAYASRYENLPNWAAGLSNGIRNDAGRWVTESPMGPVQVRFVEANDFGVLDHWVTMPDGTTFYNPARVLVLDQDSSEVVFSVRQFAGVDDDRYETDVSTVAADLRRLADLLT